MRYFWATLALIGGLAAVCWFGFFRANCDPVAQEAARRGDTMAWMRCEFHLTDEQFKAIVLVHEEQSARCAAHCAAVAAARERLEAARRAGDSAAVTAAEREERTAAEVCRASTEAHVRQVAALMTPTEGRRYLEMVLPRLEKLDHQGPPNLSLESR